MDVHFSARLKKNGETYKNSLERIVEKVSALISSITYINTMSIVFMVSFIKLT